MIASFSFGHGQLDGCTPERWEKLRDAVPSLPTLNEAKDRWYTSYTGDIRAVMRAGFEIQVSPAKSDANALLCIEERLAELVEKIGALPKVPTIENQSFNSRCSVHVPGLGLLLIDEVMVRTDYCTEKLQEDLEDGWRVLAICPQPDQRRPDYVLGRQKR
jgi:hypothetical protein